MRCPEPRGSGHHRVWRRSGYWLTALAGTRRILRGSIGLFRMFLGPEMGTRNQLFRESGQVSLATAHGQAKQESAQGRCRAGNLVSYMLGNIEHGSDIHIAGVQAQFLGGGFKPIIQCLWRQMLCHGFPFILAGAFQRLRSINVFANFINNRHPRQLKLIQGPAHRGIDQVFP